MLTKVFNRDAKQMKWKLEKRSINDLMSHPKNARILSEHDAKHLGESLDKFGLIDKPVINKNGTIIGGHQRVKVLKTRNTQEVECWVPSRNLSNAEVEELNIRLNRNNGDWDWDKLGNEWDAGSLIEWGFEEDELYNEKKKGRKPQKPSITFSFDNPEDMQLFMIDERVNFSYLKDSAEFHHGSVKVKGLEDG